MNGESRFLKIIKRNGDVVDFNHKKIEHAIFKAMRAIGKPNRKKANELSLQVVSSLEKNGTDKIPTSRKCSGFCRKSPIRIWRF